MTAPEATFEGVTIVLVGSFNPRIFQPAWFGQEDLVREIEAREAELGVVHPNLSAFKMGPFQLQINTGRFLALTVEPPSYQALRDLVLGTFRLLRHTPVIQLGINRDLHFKPNDDWSWTTLQKQLVVLSAWSGVLEESETRALVIQGSRGDENQGHIAVRVEPSGREPGGVYFNINDHYELSSPSPTGGGCDSIMRILESQFTVSLDRSAGIARRLLEATCTPSP